MQTCLQTLHRLLVVILGSFGWSQPVFAAEIPAWQDNHALQTATLDYVQHLPSIKPEFRVEVADLDSKLQLTACDKIAFSTPSPIFEGNFRVKAECRAPEKWSVFLTATVLKPSKYFVLNHSLDGSKPLSAEDITAMDEYRAHPVPGLADDINRILGLRLSHAIKGGSVIRYSDLSSEPALTRGQKVKVLAKGKGFEINQEGLLLSSTYEGQTTRVQLSSKRIISGIAHSGGIVEVP